MQLTEKHREYWRKNVNFLLLMLAIWFVVTFVVSYYARDFFSFTFFGWPFAFWMAAQGALIVYVFIIWWYARYMSKLDDEYGVSEVD
jgi:putative solute:sodium symporter small subunit